MFTQSVLRRGISQFRFLSVVAHVAVTRDLLFENSVFETHQFSLIYVLYDCICNNLSENAFAPHFLTRFFSSKSFSIACIYTRII